MKSQHKFEATHSVPLNGNIQIVPNHSLKVVSRTKDHLKISHTMIQI